MADNKDRLRQQVQRQRRKMKVLPKPQLQLPSDYSRYHSHSPTTEKQREREIQRERERERDSSDVEENEEEDEDDVAPFMGLNHGHAVQSDPPRNSKSSSSSPTKKKQRKLKELWANGTSLLPAMDHHHQNALFRSPHEKDKRNQSSDVTGSGPGTPSELQSATPLPDKKLLFVALDKFQKKDTYGVFSEPVDPEELPDYFDVIKNPMDFGTIRNNLERGNYTTLEQLEKDVLLVCSNAMSYNASGTIYYRQGRAIQELARKTFQSLRCDPEGFELERERKPALKTKYGPYSKKPSRRGGWGRSRFESTRPDLASGTSLTSSGERADWSNDAVKLRKGPALERSGTFLDATGRNLQGHHTADINSPAEFSEELSGSMLKGTAFRDGRRDLLLEENRRATYKPWNILMTGNDSIFVTLGGNSKQLVDTGIQSEYAYARSLACFSAELGPAAWKIAGKKIEKSLPAGVPFGPGWVGDYEAPRSALLLREESNDQQTSTTSTAIPTDHGVNKVVQLTSDQASAKNQGCEGQSYLSSSTVVGPTYIVPATQSATIPVSQSTSPHLTTDKIIKSHAQAVKEVGLKSASPVVESTEVNLAGAKFASDVSQSRLLEIVSRNSNNRLMQWTSTKQADRTQPVSSLQASAAGSVGPERRLDGTSNCTGRESRDDSKPPTNSGSTNVAVNAVEPSAPNHEDSYRIGRVPQSTSSQEHAMQDFSRLVSSSQSKMLGMQQRASNMTVTTPLFGFSSSPSRPTTVSVEDAVAEAWARSRVADLAHADTSPRIKMQITPESYYNTQQSQARPSSSIPQFMQQQTPMDMPSLYMQSQLSRMHPQNLSKFSHTVSRGNAGQLADSSNSNTFSHFNYMRTPVEAESSQSQQCLWQSVPSKHPFQQTSDFSHSIPPDLNVGFQSPKSPVRQSSGVMADSQPDLALQL